MPDLLVRLYDLPVFQSEARIAAQGVVIRRAIAPEAHIVRAWIRQRFHENWVDEASKGMSQNPVTTWLAIRGTTLVGFACHDATAKGFFGPTGVDEAERGKGIGEALLIVTLRAMREAGYGYAIIGSPGPVAFYKKRIDALEIPGSEPGIYAGMLRD